MQYFHLFIYTINISFFLLHCIYNLSYCEEGIRTYHAYFKWCPSDSYYNYVLVNSCNHFFDFYSPWYFILYKYKAMQKTTQQTKKGNQASPWTGRLWVAIYVGWSLQMPLLEITTSSPHTIKGSRTLAKFAGKMTV